MKKMVLLIASLMVVLSTTEVIADHNNGNGWQQSGWDNQHVILFSDCGYGGLSKSVPIGNYARLRDIGVEHNQVSSIIVPQGLAVEMFQKRKFGGHWYRINQNQICLKGKWNDRMGSMRVVEDDPRNSYGFENNYSSNQSNQGKSCHPFVVRSYNGPGAIRFVDDEQRLTRIKSGRSLKGDFCRKGSARIELAKQERGGDVVLQIADREYRFEPWSQYDDFRGKWYRRYINIELPRVRNNQNNVVYGGNGWGNTPGFGKRYSSGVNNGANWGNNYQGKWYRPRAVASTNSGSGGSTYGNNNAATDCVSYTVTGNHKDVGVRFFAGSEEFHLTGKGKQTRQLCHTGSIRMELAKKKIPAEVVVYIGGKAFKFRAGDKGDRFAKTWYRKYFELNLR